MARSGLLIDYDYCCGCHTCEIACQKEHSYEVDQWGIMVQQIGPWPIEGTKKYNYDYIPVPTKLCDLCADRTKEGKLPTCVQHCQTACMQYGPVDELVKELEEKPRRTIFTPC